MVQNQRNVILGDPPNQQKALMGDPPNQQKALNIAIFGLFQGQNQQKRLIKSEEWPE